MRISYRTIFLVFLLSGMAAYGFASPGTQVNIRMDSIPGLHQQILYSILDLKFAKADSLLSLMDEQEPDEPETPYLENYLEFLDALIIGDIESFQNYQEASGKRIESIKNGRKVNPGSFFALSTIHLQSSVLCAFHNEMFRAAKHLYHSNRYLRQGEEAEIGNPRKFRNRGILILVSASVPEEYRWLLKVFGFKYGIEEGFGYLEEYYTFAVGADRLEAYLILDYARQTLTPEKNNPENSGLSESSRIPGIPGDANAFHNRAETLKLYSRALSDLSSGNSLRVVKNLQNYSQDSLERELPYLDLLLGEALLNSLDPGAEKPLKQFTLKNNAVHYRHYAWHKLSWTFALKGDMENYQEARQKVMDAGEPYLDADRQALSEARDTLPLNIGLLKARLLFDGGDYSGALEVLDMSSGIFLHNKRDSIEYPYRKARILDRLEERSRAMISYKKVIAEGSEQSWYFAPNAALQLGIIYEEEREYDLALEYYRKCLKINESSYKQSIDYKARQGIRRIENQKKLR